MTAAKKLPSLFRSKSAVQKREEEEEKRELLKQKRELELLRKKVVEKLKSDFKMPPKAAIIISDMIDDKRKSKKT